MTASLGALTAPLIASDSVPSSLREVQRKEARGEPVDRTVLLANDANQASDQLRWSTGQVKINNQWTSLSKLDMLDQKLEKYEQQRDQSDQTVRSQLELAHWCRKQGLEDQSVAHLYAVLAMEPNHLVARKELQHQWLNDRWFTPKEIEAAREESKQMVRDVETWTPTIREILRLLQASDSDRKVAAIEKLEAIDDPSAIPAMELAVNVVDDQLGLPLVKKIAQFRTPQACKALLLFSLAGPTSPIARASLNELKTLPEALVIPELLNALSMPIEVSTHIVGLPNGRLALTTLVSRELKDRKLVQRSENQFRVVSQFQSTAVAMHQHRDTVQTNREFLDGRTSSETITTTQTSTASGTVAAQYVPEALFTAARSNVQERANQLREDAAAENLRIQKRVARVCSILREVSGQSIEDSPQAWWEWWSLRNDKYEPKNAKPIVQRNYYDEKDLTVATTRSRIDLSDTSSQRTETLRGLSTHSSCLVAGTTVQTQSGLRPVDQIKVGDLVVSQDVETGELALKPVIRTTRAEGRPLVAIVTEHETIKATPSHFWWVAGHGWKRSSELEAGMQLHTATGTVAVRETQAAETEPTFNLVVDQFHTYFVGPDRILSYDVMPLKGSLRLVPGYDQLVQK